MGRLDSLHPQVHKGGLPPEDLPSKVELVVGDVTDATAWDAPSPTSPPT